jgi:hypothetical protein
MAVPDQVSRARAQLQHAREIRREQAADFWQRTIMSDGPEDEEEDWFRPVWETEDELDPPGPPFYAEILRF